MPTARSLDQIKANLLQPALTSHFEVSIYPPKGLTPEYFQANGLNFGFNSTNIDKLNLLCSETVLPGSSLATFELNNDYHGATVRHAHRRLYDDRIELTFYVSADDYLPIRFFETWIKYVAGESITGTSEPTGTRPGSQKSHYFYRFNYPDNYVSKGPDNEGGLSITKFERTGSGDSYSGNTLKYQFIDVFPIAINSMPVSYDASSLLKCTVSLTYVRYVLLPPPGDSAHKDQYNSQVSSSTSSTAALTPAQQATFNSTANALTGTNALATPVTGLNVGGVPTSSANASGNVVS